MNQIKIFLASSSELKKDREQVEIFVGRFNNTSLQKGYYFELVIWENFLDTMAAEGIQNRYNQAIKDCEIFVMLFFTKVGIYTDEEFEVAFGNFKTAGKPFIFTFFKNEQIYIDDIIEKDILSLINFKKKLKEYKHYYSSYKNIEDLKFQLNNQINKLINEGLIIEKNIAIDPVLKAMLEEIKVFCKKNNIYIYTANILHTLLQNTNGMLFQCLNNAKKGYADFLNIKLMQLINLEFINKKKARPFIEQDWYLREDISRACEYAIRENALNMNEKHLLLGLIELDGSTIKMIQHDLTTSEWNSFLSNIKTNNNNITPIGAY